MLDKTPVVYLVGRSYQIVFYCREYGIAWAEIGGDVYPDEKNGLLISQTNVHKITVPADRMDAAGAYTLCFRALPERKPYWPELGDVVRRTFAFRPVLGSELTAFCVADAHSHIDEVVQAALVKGVPDMLLMNGDIPAESKTEEDLLAILDIAGKITGGERPVVFARGNHDLRGKYAADLINYIGDDQGNTYFTFRTGDLWGIVLDCGEDKWDTSDEYGGIVCCEPLRRRQIDFLKDVIARKAQEYAAEGVKNRIALCHIPFMTNLMRGQFDIETDVYTQWTNLLNEMNIDMMLCGHMHTLHALPVGCSDMRYGANFPVVVCSLPKFSRENPQDSRFTGGLVRISWQGIRVDFVDNLGSTTPAFLVEAE